MENIPNGIRQKTELSYVTLACYVEKSRKPSDVLGWSDSLNDDKNNSWTINRKRLESNGGE